MIKRTLERVWSPQLRNRRVVDVYLPWSYPSGVRYPVVYMHDGQNLFDPTTAFGGNEWKVDESFDAAAESGAFPEAIVIGIENTAKASTPEELLKVLQARGKGPRFIHAIIEAELTTEEIIALTEEFCAHNYKPLPVALVA